jgi:hypothetical protein
VVWPNDLADFVHNHRAHGPLTADATEPAWNGYLLQMACPCGVVFERWVPPMLSLNAARAPRIPSTPVGFTSPRFGIRISSMSET